MRQARARWFAAVVGGALLGGLPPPLHAQAPTDIAPRRVQVVSANPFTLLAGWGNVEYERRLSPSSTWGASGSFFSIDESDYRSANTMVRYYPARSALSGFFVGGRLGVFRITDTLESGTHGGVGIEMGYTWLLGSARRLGISTGGGAVRLFGGSSTGAMVFIPTVRLNMGIAF
jgi:uncharacterized protein DUF3575